MPLIGLTGRRKSANQVDGVPGPLVHLSLDVFFSPYSAAIAAAGGLPVNLPFDLAAAGPDALEAVVGRLDGLLLSGGADLDPARYGADSETDLYPPEPARDEFEFELYRTARSAGLPVLGICRGVQLINVAEGGSLNQHVPAHARFDEDPAHLAHSVAIEAGSCLAAIYGPEASSISVNSLHHQTIERVAPGLVVSARSEDGTIEGLEVPGEPVVAVQWHPEMMNGASSDPIFAWFIDAARQAQ